MAIRLPPVGEFHHLIMPIGATATKLETCPAQTNPGFAVVVGAAGGFTITVTDVRDELTQTDEFQAIIM